MLDRASDKTNVLGSRVNVLCLLRFLKWAEEEALLAAGDTIAANHIAEASARLRGKFEVRPDELFNEHLANV